MVNYVFNPRLSGKHHRRPIYWLETAVKMDFVRFVEMQNTMAHAFNRFYINRIGENKVHYTMPNIENGIFLSYNFIKNV